MTKTTIIRNIIGLGIAATTLFSCQPETETKETSNGLVTKLSSEDLNTIDQINSITKPDTLISPAYASLDTPEKTLAFLREREQYCWDYLAYAEKSKYDNVDRLIDEISYNKSHKSTDLEDAKELSKKLKSLYLTREGISDPTKIVNDSINDYVLQQIFAIGDSTANMNNHPLFKELKNDIMLLNNDEIVSRRTNHSTAVFHLNNYINENKATLEAAGLDTKTVDGWTN